MSTSSALASDALGVWVRGSLSCGADGHYVWAGVWAMNEAQLLAGTTSAFSYRSTEARGLVAPTFAVGASDDGVTLFPIRANVSTEDQVLVHRVSGAFTGSFDLLRANGERVSVEDPDFRLMLTAPLPPSGASLTPAAGIGGGVANWKVAGGGRNEYGQFVVLGAWTPDDALMEVRKGYLTAPTPKAKAAKPKPKPKTKAKAAAAAALALPILKGAIAATSDAVVWTGQWGYGEKAFVPLVEGAASLSDFSYTRMLSAAPAAAAAAAAASAHAPSAAAAPAEGAAPAPPAPPLVAVDLAVPSTLSGIYTGYFHVGSTDASKQPTRVEEVDLALTFDAAALAAAPLTSAAAPPPPAPLPAGVVRVRGVGKNNFGAFTFEGTYVVATRTLECKKLYAVKVKTPKPKKPRAKKAKKAAGERRASGRAGAGDAAVAAPGAAGQPASGRGSFSSFLKPTPRSTGRKRVIPQFLRNKQADKLEKSVGPGVGRCLLLLDRIEKHDLSVPFRLPVDPAVVPGYTDIVKNPIDLSHIKARLEQGGYSRPDLFEADMQLMWNNALQYNQEKTPMHSITLRLRAFFNKYYGEVMKALRDEAPKPKPVRAPAAERPKKRKSGAAKSKASGEGGAAPRSRPAAKPARKKRRRNRNASDVSSAEKSKIQALEERLAKFEAMMPQMMGGGGMGMMGGSSAKKPSKSARKPAAEKDVSFQEKRNLSREINRLPGDKLTKVLQIITERMPIENKGDEIEVDIDTLDNATLRELQKYVKRVFAQDKARAKRERERSEQGGDPADRARHATQQAASNQEEIDRLERELGGGYEFHGGGGGYDGGAASTNFLNDLGGY